MEQWRKDARHEPIIVDWEALVPKGHLLRKIEKVMDYGWLLSAYVFVNANLKAVCSMHAFYPTACVSTHAVVLCDMNGRQMPLSPAPTSSSVPLGLIRRGYVSHKYIGPSVTP